MTRNDKVTSGSRKRTCTAEQVGFRIRAQKKRRSLSRVFVTNVSELFFLVVFLCCLDTTVVLGLCFGLFHGLLGFRGLLGAGFGALLALFVEHLLAAQQLDEGLIGAVTFVPAGANNAQISAVAVPEAGTNGVKQLDHGIVGHEVGRSQTACREISSLAERDHLLAQR